MSKRVTRYFISIFFSTMVALWATCGTVWRGQTKETGYSRVLGTGTKIQLEKKPDRNRGKRVRMRIFLTCQYERIIIFLTLKVNNRYLHRETRTARDGIKNNGLK